MKRKTKVYGLLICCFFLGLALPVKTQVFDPEGRQACFWDLGTASAGGYYRCSPSGNCAWRDNYEPETGVSNCPEWPN